VIDELGIEAKAPQRLTQKLVEILLSTNLKLVMR